MSVKNISTLNEKNKHIIPAIEKSLVDSTIYKNPWVRPADWTILTDPTSAEEKIVGLHAVWPGDTSCNWVTFQCSGPYTVDWGDGNIENFSASGIALHFYNYNSASITATSSLGYKMVVITITPQAGQHITLLNFHIKPSGTGGDASAFPSSGWLDLRVSVPYLYSFILGCVHNKSNTTLAQAIRHSYLEQFSLINSKLNSPFALLYNLTALKSVPVLKLNPNAKPVSKINCSWSAGGNTITSTNHGLSVGDVIGFFYMSSAGTYPSYIYGSETAIEYYVINPTTDTFQIAYAPIDSPAIGSFTYTSSGSFYSGGYSLNCTFYGSGIENIDSTTIETSSVWNWMRAFYNCTNLKTVNFDFSNLYIASSTFFNCFSLTYISPIISKNPLYLYSTFRYCYSLKNAPNFTTSAISGGTNYYTFANCNSLSYVPSYDFRPSKNLTNMFLNCVSLRYVPQLSLGPENLQTDYMFAGCSNLEKIDGNLNLSYIIDCTYMFSNCYSLIKGPNITFPTSAGNWNGSYLFNNCYSLKEIPNYDFSSITTATSMFYNCYSLRSLDNFNFSKLTNLTGTFQYMTNLEKIGNINAPQCVTIASIFSYCLNLKSIGELTLKPTGTSFAANSAFSHCEKLKYPPVFTTKDLSGFTTVGSLNNMFEYCYSLQSGPSLYLGGLVNTGGESNMFLHCNSLETINISGCGSSIGFSNTTKLGETQIEDFCQYGIVDGSTASVPTLTLTYSSAITGNLAMAATSTINSKTLTGITSTTGIVPGMLIDGYVTSKTATASFTDSGDIVTHTSHNLVAGTKISFRTIVTTTGISKNYTYYVVNPTTNTFQVASYLGGPALPLTNNGTGTYVVPSYVVSTTATTVTMTAPAVSAGASSTYFIKCDYAPAILKGFTVTL